MGISFSLLYGINGLEIIINGPARPRRCRVCIINVSVSHPHRVVKIGYEACIENIVHNFTASGASRLVCSLVLI